MNKVPQPQIGEGYYSIGTVLYYHGKDWTPDDHRVVMPDVCRDKGWIVTPEHLAAYNKQTDEVIERYQQARARRTPEQIAEEAYEMRAAFGPGQKVVNIFTGEETTT